MCFSLFPPVHMTFDQLLHAVKKIPNVASVLQKPGNGGVMNVNTIPIQMFLAWLPG